MKKIFWAILLIAALFVGIVAGQVLQDILFKPKFEYDISETIAAKYDAVPYSLGTLLINYEHNYTIPDNGSWAIKVYYPGNLTVGFDSLPSNTTFSNFTVQLWNITADPNALVGSFDMTGGQIFIETQPAEYVYRFIFTVATTATDGETGTITLFVGFTAA